MIGSRWNILRRRIVRFILYLKNFFWLLCEEWRKRGRSGNRLGKREGNKRGRELVVVLIREVVGEKVRRG